MDLKDLREEYRDDTLNMNDCCANPFDQFEKWMDEVVETELPEPNAMVLATSIDFPSQRIVLLKEVITEGFVFFTNYESNKGKDILQQPKVSLLFPWHAIQRQVIIYGTAKKVSREASEEYFQSRPKKSQLGALVSPQSSLIAKRDVLEEKMKVAEKRYTDLPVPLPENWGGYCVTPHLFEFWQGRRSRLHDRIVYESNAENKWKLSRLAP